NTEGWHGICADYDWNINVATDLGYGWLLTNSYGDINENGLIELEIHVARAIRNAIWLPSRFPSGTWIEAKGWWVQDYGHDAKTELHPVKLLIGGKRTSQQFNVFAAQDESNRFDV